MPVEAGALVASRDCLRSCTLAAVDAVRTVIEAVVDVETCSSYPLARCPLPSARTSYLSDRERVKRFKVQQSQWSTSSALAVVWDVIRAEVSSHPIRKAKTVICLGVN